LIVCLLVGRVLVAAWMSWHHVAQALPDHKVWQRGPRLVAGLWAPRPATVIIGLSFLGMMLMAGPWAYTELLSEWAAGMPHHISVRVVLAVALFAGAGLGGWTAGKWRWQGVSGRDIARCLTGGALMGMGSLLIPGGNDGLILVGMPMLWPYAWLAFATMCVTIAALMRWPLR
jgi:toxin CptA